MIPNFGEMEEVKCPDCHGPLIIVPVEGAPGRYRFDGCRCGREQFVLPDFVGAGITGGPLFLFKLKAR